MGVRLPSVSSTAIVNAAPVNAAETIVCTTGPINLSIENQFVLLFAYCIFIVGATNTSVTMRLRRGNALTSPQLNINGNNQLGAATPFSLAINYVDVGAGAGAALFYTLTYQGNGASGNATILDVALTAMCL